MKQFEPHCLMTWASQCAGADEQLSYCERTVESVLTELNHSAAVLAEIERLPMPLDEIAQMRRTTHEWIARRAISEAQAIQDARKAIAVARLPAVEGRAA